MHRTEWVIKRLLYAVVTIFVAVTFSFVLFSRISAAF